MELTPVEARIIGVLLEKEITTPDQYPLSLNALTLGCNQKSSRDPVMSLTEQDTQAGLDSLTKKRLISEQSGFGSRVVKYTHRFCNTEFSDLQLNAAEVAILCLLLLRGPQTPGELRTRSNRLHAFADVLEVEQTLTRLSAHTPPLVSLLPKEPGKREARFDECFTPKKPQAHSYASQPSEQNHQTAQDDCCAQGEGNMAVILSQDYEQLQMRVKQLEEEVSHLKTALADLL